MEAFLAFLEHVHSLLTTTYHNTPIMLMASPQWTRPDVEAIARYVFERTRTPALCLIHSGIATQYGLKWPHMTVVDVGFQKVDVTCIYDSRVVNHMDVGGAAADALAVAEGWEDISGGEVFTRKLLGLLEDKGFTYEMAEQLKKSNICEVLPYVSDSPRLMELPEEAPATEKAAAATAGGATDAPRGGEGTGVSAAVVDDDEEGVDADKIVTEDGVLDVAKLVVEGQTKEFLAKKEKEKAEKAKAGRKGKDKDGEAAKPVRLPNSRRAKNVFHFEEVIQEEVPPQPAQPAAVPAAATDAEKTTGTETTQAEKPAEPEATNGDVPKTDTEQPKAEPEASEAPKPEPTALAQPALPTFRNKRVRKDIEIGLERFLFADRAEIDRISTAIYRAVQGIEDMYMRPSCWENLVFVGNGARIRGLKDNIIQTLSARHLISPSTATIFTSELPSNLATPTGTGSQTPTGSYVGGPPHQLGPSSGVNPLLQAATTASLGVPGGLGGQPGTPGPTSNAGDVQGQTHHFHSQTPTNIKLAGLPTYLSEWTKNGFEEAMFLGAQVAARLAFCVHNLDAQGVESQRLMSLSRVDYK
jgi:actin-related protein 9